MDLLSYTVTNPVILILLSFAGGLFAGFLARKFLESSNTMVLTVMVLWELELPFWVSLVWCGFAPCQDPEVISSSSFMPWSSV